MKKIPVPCDGSQSAPRAVGHAAAEAAQAGHALQPASAVLDGAGVRYNLHCRFGEPATEIAAHVRDAGCDAVVMGTHGRGALANLVIGSVATQVVRRVDVPLTLIK
jgi:nucleotide-binding universal stress UspA family protein